MEPYISQTQPACLPPGQHARFHPRETDIKWCDIHVEEEPESPARNVHVNEPAAFPDNDPEPAAYMGGQWIWQAEDDWSDDEDWQEGNQNLYPDSVPVYSMSPRPRQTQPGK